MFLNSAGDDASRFGATRRDEGEPAFTPLVAMADRVREVMESMVPELEDLQRRKLCTPGEVKQLARRRERFEYLIHRCGAAASGRACSDRARNRRWRSCCRRRPYPPRAAAPAQAAVDA